MIAKFIPNVNQGHSCLSKRVWYSLSFLVYFPICNGFNFFGLLYRASVALFLSVFVLHTTQRDKKLTPDAPEPEGSCHQHAVRGRPSAPLPCRAVARPKGAGSVTPPPNGNTHTREFYSELSFDALEGAQLSRAVKYRCHEWYGK